MTIAASFGEIVKHTKPDEDFPLFYGMANQIISDVDEAVKAKLIPSASIFLEKITEE